MIKPSLSRVLRFFFIIPAVLLFSFILLELSPIDPVEAYIGADVLRVGPEQRAQIAARWGLDQPAPLRLGHWLLRFVQGDLGTSLIFNRPVVEVMGERVSASLALMGGAWLLAGLGGVTLGLWAGVRRGRWTDRLIRSLAYVLAASPPFWLGMLLIIVFAVGLDLLPACCAAPPGVAPATAPLGLRLRHLLLPVLTLGLAGMAPVALHTRKKVMEILASEHVLFARSLGERGIGLYLRQVLPNVLLPAITLQFASLSELFGGSVLAEHVFSYPGLGRTAVLAGLRSDVPLLLGIVLFSTLFVFCGNTLADLSYYLIDPRLRTKGRKKR